MKRFRGKKMVNNKIVKTVTPTTDMFRVRNQLSFIELCFDACNKPEPQTEEDPQHEQVEEAQEPADGHKIQERRKLDGLNVTVMMQNLKRAIRQEQEQDLLDIGSLGRIVLILVTEEQ